MDCPKICLSTMTSTPGRREALVIVGDADALIAIIAAEKTCAASCLGSQKGPPMTALKSLVFLILVAGLGAAYIPFALLPQGPKVEEPPVVAKRKGGRPRKNP